MTSSMITLIRHGLNLRGERLTRKGMKDGSTGFTPTTYRDALVPIIHLLKNKRDFTQSIGSVATMANTAGSRTIPYQGSLLRVNSLGSSARVSTLMIKKDSEKKFRKVNFCSKPFLMHRRLHCG